MGFVAVWLLWIWGVQGVPDNFIVVLSVERHLVLTQVNFGTECPPRNDKPWHLDGRYLRAVLRGGLQIALVKCFISREKLCCAVEGWLVGDGILVEESLRCVTAKVFPEARYATKAPLSPDFFTIWLKRFLRSFLAFQACHWSVWNKGQATAVSSCFADLVAWFN